MLKKDYTDTIMTIEGYPKTSDPDESLIEEYWWAVTYGDEDMQRYYENLLGVHAIE